MIRSIGVLFLALQLWGQATTVLRLQRYEPDYRFRFQTEYRVEGQKPLALALRGGSAKGLAHLGVLQGFDDENLGIDAVVGTSAGSLMGSLYASGFSASGIARIFKSRDFGLAFDERQRSLGWSLSEDEIAHSTPYRLVIRDGKPDLVPGKATSRHVRAALLPMLGRASWLAEEDFDRLRMPLRVVASDLTAGTGKVFSDGPLVDVVMASMCIPGIFEPVVIQGHQYVDGGPFENLPVMASRREFPDMIQVGVAIGRPWDATLKTNLPRLLDASLDMAMAQTEARSLAGADLVIRPGTGDADEFDFYHQVDRLVSEGRKAFEDQRARLEELVYGPDSGRTAATGIRLEAEDVPEAAGWLQDLHLPRVLTLRDCYRLLRKAYRDLSISDAEVRLPSRAEDEALVVLRPAPMITRVELDLPGDWPQEARAYIAGMLASGYGLAPRRRFSEGAWRRAIEDLLVDAILKQVPILDVQGSGLGPGGVLRLRVREPRVEEIRSHDQAVRAFLSQLFTRIKDQPVRTDVLTEGLARAESRLNLSDLKPSFVQQGASLALDVEASRPPRLELAPHIAYENDWGPHLAPGCQPAQCPWHGFALPVPWRARQPADQPGWAAAQRLRALAARGVRPGRLGGQALVRQPRSGPGRQTGPAEVLGPGPGPVQCPGEGLLQFDAGQMRGSTRKTGVEGPEHRAEYGRAALEWDSFDAHTLPTEGALVRASFTRAFRSEAGPTFSTGYLRLRRLWRNNGSGRLPGLDLDLEAAGQQDAPEERWSVAGGPDFIIGTPSASLLAPNFRVLRVGFPFSMTTLFGVAVQAVPRIDLGQISEDFHHFDDGRRVLGGGVILRAVVMSFYVELTGGLVRIQDPRTDTISRNKHINFLIGTRPFDLWKER